MPLYLKRSLCRAFLCLAAIVSALTHPAWAATINVPADQKTIQAGIDAAANGDTVLVAPGTYYENIDFKGKAITVTSSGGATVTTINGGKIAPAVLFITSETRSSILSNFTITGGQGFTDQRLGGIYAYLSSPTIQSNIITANSCYGVNSQYASPLVKTNEISFTKQVTNVCGFASGAGIWLDGDQLNTPSVIPEIIGNVIEENTEAGLADAGGSGGAGIAVWLGTSVIANNVIRNNATGGGVGGGIYFMAFSRGLLINNLIYGNTAVLAGGGVFISNFSDDTGTLALINNTIVDNVATHSSNEATSYQILGGQQLVYGPAGDPSIAGNLIIENNIVGGATADPSVLCESGSNPVVYRHNNFYNNAGPTAAPYEGTCTFPAGVDGNISGNPSFVSTASQNYHLLASSIGLDAGDNAAVDTAVSLGFSDTTDLDGKPRVQDATGNGCTIDMGAYEYLGATTECSTTTETLHSSLNPSTFGQTVTFTAQLTSTNGTPAGDVQFTDGSTVLGTVAIANTGVAVFTTSLLTIGSHTITAAYLPSGTLSTTTASLTQVVNGYSTTTGLTSSINPATAGQSITFTATVTSSNGTPTGLVTFTDGASTLGTQTLVNGVATFTTTTLAAGTHPITAVYNPTVTTFTASNAMLSQVVKGIATSISLTVTPTTAVYGTNIVMAATVSFTNSETFGGGITFMDGATIIAAGQTLPGSSTLTFNDIYLAVGTHTITAAYSGDPTHSASTSAPVTVIITGAAATTLAFSATPNPALAFQQITLNANLAGTTAARAPVSTVTFLKNGVAIGTAQTNASGLANFTTSLPAGTYSLTAVFAGTTNFTASTSAPITEVVNKDASLVTFGVSPNPAYSPGGIVGLSATVQPAASTLATNYAPPTGILTFYDGAAIVATGTAPSLANVPAALLSNLAVGTHVLTAVYSGDANYLPSTSAPVTLNVLLSDFTLTADPTLTIRTEHHKNLNLNLASLGNFSDAIALSCGPLPAEVSCTFVNNGPMLAAGTTVPGSVVINTDAIYNFLSRVHRPLSRLPWSSTLGSIAFALLLPFALVAGVRRPTALGRNLRLFVSVSLLFVAVSVTGCSGHYPAHTPPGTYTFEITGQGVTTHVSHTATITLIVTE